MNHEAFEDNGAHLGVYFILDESRNEPPMRRAHLMMKASALLDAGSPQRNELNELANELQDVEQCTARIIGAIREKNAEMIANNAAIAFLLLRLEESSLATKFTITGDIMNLGLTHMDGEQAHQQWVSAYTRFHAFAQRFDLYMFRLRTRHWERSNAEATAEFEAAEAKAKSAAIVPTGRRSAA